MKGGRTAPRNDPQQTPNELHTRASMKGGRTAPRNSYVGGVSASDIQSFNEGGADCPPKRTAKYLGRTWTELQ